MLIEIFIFLITTVFVYIYYGHKRNHQFFRSRGVKFIPGVPIFGNAYKSSTLKQHVCYDIDDIYKQFPGERYVGYIEGTVPILLIRDPEIIKKITVKDFDHFVDHRKFFGDPIFSDSLLQLQGDKWRDMRTTLSPAFTGSKMRLMVPFMIETSENFVQYLKDNNQNKDTDVDDIIRKYTNDIIASSAFGLQVNSLKDPNNEFYKTGQNLMTFNLWQRFKMFVTMVFPFLSKFTVIFPPETTDFFKNIVKRTMDYREKNNVERPDMIQLLMEASKGTLNTNAVENEKTSNIGFATTEEANLKPKTENRRWTLDEIAAQAFIFFFAGFESAASTLVMAIHELALNQDVQQKLYEEVKKHEELHGKLTFEGIQNLKYLDCVMNETMRKWAAALILDRTCLKSYTLPPPREGGEPYKIEPGQVVYNSVNSIHWDEEHYPEPKVFNPDRFSDENKHNIKPFTFLPFGIGPRNCIGSRFALLELKILLYYLVLNFKINKTQKTSDPICLISNDFNMKAEGGSWVQFQTRLNA